VPRQEKQVVVLAPAERHAMPAGEIIKSPLIVQGQGLLDRPAEISEFLGAKGINALADFKAGGRGIRRGPCGNAQWLLLAADGEE
jgi:hypothetical protein